MCPALFVAVLVDIAAAVQVMAVALAGMMILALAIEARRTSARPLDKSSFDDAWPPGIIPPASYRDTLRAP